MNKGEEIHNYIITCVDKNYIYQCFCMYVHDCQLLSGVIYFQPEELPLAFLERQIRWQQILYICSSGYVFISPSFRKNCLARYEIWH